MPLLEYSLCSCPKGGISIAICSQMNNSLTMVLLGEDENDVGLAIVAVTVKWSGKPLEFMSHFSALLAVSANAVS